MTIPVILYDIDNNSIPLNCISKANTFFIRSFQTFGIEIIYSENNTIIYSVKQNPNSTTEDDIVLINENYIFQPTENFAYSIFLESDVQIRVWNLSGESVLYNIEYRPENIEPEHYNDLLDNNFLPNFTQLLPAVIDGNTGELIKRLLIDFKNIRKHKGTITGIEKFLNLIGFDPDTIKVYPEFLTPSGNKTINPNTKVDIKTGDYHVIFENYHIDNDDKYTIKNMPKAILGIKNLDELFDKLYYALSLANIYFTLPEQDIAFFGVNYMTNSEQYLSVAGNTYVTYAQNPHHYVNDLKINMYTNYDNTLKRYIIVNNKQVTETTEKTEVRYKPKPTQPNNELFAVDVEYFDNVENDLDFESMSIFGNLLNLSILSVGNYIKYEIKKVGNDFTKIISQSVIGTEIPEEIKFIGTVSGEYRLIVTITDFWNNQDVYAYSYTIDNTKALIDFKVFNSAVLTEEMNELNLDVSSPSLTTVETENYILPLVNVPNLLNDYFDIDVTGIQTLQYLMGTKKYLTPEVNKNYIVDKATDMPIDYMDNWLHIISVKKLPNHQLKLRITEPYYNKLEIIDIGTSEIEFDNDLFVTDLAINELVDGEIVVNNYLLITTRSGGIDIIPELFDLVYVDNTIPDAVEIHSLYDLVDLIEEVKIPVNYDFELFHRLVSTDNFPQLTTDDKLIVKSLFPRLTNDNYNVKLGDILGCTINEQYINNQQNVRWEVRNTFTNELLFETTDRMLKYRISDNMIYTVILMFGVGTDNYVINKSSVVSSFIV